MVLDRHAGATGARDDPQPPLFTHLVKFTVAAPEDLAGPLDRHDRRQLKTLNEFFEGHRRNSVDL
jgi:hypothetical protein